MEQKIYDADAGARIDVKFHSILFSMSNNKLLIKVLEYIGFILERSVKFNRSVILQKHDKARDILNCHMNIYDAILKRDMALAQQAVEKHFELVHKCM